MLSESCGIRIVGCVSGAGVIRGPKQGEIFNNDILNAISAIMLLFDLGNLFVV